ncbi:hypothetical protein EAS54_18865 [Bradyrhizobium guangzhouense]|nr:hypothetical protein EAS54_18865 [Bradyrhizobium guangzhouense]
MNAFSVTSYEPATLTFVVLGSSSGVGRADDLEKPLAERVGFELAKLADGWAGDGSVAPSIKVVRDVGLVLNQLPFKTRIPIVDIDEENGSVAVRWIADDRMKSFSLVFRGNGKVSGVLATIDPPRSKSWSFEVGEEVQIASKLEEPSVRHLIES